MNLKKRLEKTQILLKKHNQQHLLFFWDNLTDFQQAGLLDQIEELDFEKIQQWVADLIKKEPASSSLANIKPATFYPSSPINTQQSHKYLQATALGENLLKQGKVAAFLVAGGQGTRLGFDGPKGNFPISPVKNKTLFRLFAETIKTVSQKYNTICPWYIMTSELNHTETIEIFHTNNFFSLNEKDIFFFQQGTLPNFGLDGKILMADKANIASSPDGHGGSLKALYKSSAVADMKKRGIEYISYFQVDNPLVNIFDTLFIGLHALDKSQMSSKALVKSNPLEKVGNFCLVDGKVTVIEYSDLPDELAKKKNPDGSLVFQLGSIAIHILSVEFIEKLNSKGFSLPLHRAVKKIPHIDEKGNLINPSQPNGIKLETFVFDALPLASDSIILQTIREEEFAPVKNASGTDSDQSSKQMMIDRAAHWLESAGVTVPRKQDGSPDCILEIAPAFALNTADIKSKINKIPHIKPGDSLYLE